MIVALIPASSHSKDVAIRIDSINSAEVYKFPHMIGIVDTRVSGMTGPTRPRTQKDASTDFHITLPLLLRGWKTH